MAYYIIRLIELNFNLSQCRFALFLVDFSGVYTRIEVLLAHLLADSCRFLRAFQICY